MLISGNGAALALPSLSTNATLANAAREHSCDMQQHGDLNDRGSDGSTPSERIGAAGIPFSSAAENIGTAAGASPLAAAGTIDGNILSSPVYRANMLNPLFAQVGVGVVYVNGQAWATEDFVG